MPGHFFAYKKNGWSKIPLWLSCMGTLTHKGRMMTNQDIINALPKGTRQRACQCVSELGIGSEAFWAHVRGNNWAKAAEALVTTQEAFKYLLTVALLADMIWEG
jgi:hypothetical protein